MNNADAFCYLGIYLFREGRYFQSDIGKLLAILLRHNIIRVVESKESPYIPVRVGRICLCSSCTVCIQSTTTSYKKIIHPIPCWRGARLCKMLVSIQILHDKNIYTCASLLPKHKYMHCSSAA